VNHEPPRHEKIRFRRTEIVDLDALPSAAEHAPARRRSFPGRFLKAASVAFAILAGAAGLFALAVLLVANSDLGAERLRAEAEKAITEAAGVDVGASLGSASMSVDGARLLAVEVRDVSLDAADGNSIVEAGLVRFGIRFLPLLTGNLKLGSAKIYDARIRTAAILPATGGDWTEILKNEAGLIDPDKVSQVLFDQIHNALDWLRAGSTDRIELENVEIALPEDGSLRLLHVRTASLTSSGKGKLSVDSEIEIDGRILSIKGSASRNAATRRVTGLDLAIAGKAPPAAAGLDGENRLGPFELTLTGAEGVEGSPARLGIALQIDDAVIDFGKNDTFHGDIWLQATLLEGANKLEIDRLRVVTGRSSLEFNGALGPRPPSGLPDETPVYRYELVSTDTTLAPAGSPEPRLGFQARVSGIYNPEANQIVADEIAVRSGSGAALGSASVTFMSGGAPGIALAVTVSSMEVAHAKQLWPWFAAKGARKWVLDHLFGGRVSEGRLQFRVPPGRLGNGVPLNAEEVSGHFRIEGTRFDTAGLMPPVRDAMGAVDFRGNEVDISLSAGTVYMQSGRSVAASNGTLRIEKANRKPLIGTLDLDVEGDAAAITELASYEPVNAMRHVPLSPDDFSGKVRGNIKGDIPLQKNIDAGKMQWRVVLDYEGLTLASPIDGQKISGADGTIIVEPGQAVIEAKAELNGLPAEISLVEPLRADGPERKRKIALILDDKARETLMPGLASLVSGTVKVELDVANKNTQPVSADLTDARLDIPWVGWSKGRGIKASLAFMLQKNEGGSALSDFRLEGETFAMNGEVALEKGGLASARFDSVRLNRSDDIAVSIRRSGKAFAVKVTGRSMDARSLIKRYTSDEGATAQSTQDDAVSIDVDVASIGGFNGETLSNVTLRYDASGSRVNDLQISAATGSGAAVTANSTSGGGRRSVKLQSADAGAIMRFLNIYQHMEGGQIGATLAAEGDGPMTGRIDARNFWVVNEPKLASIVSTTPPGDRRSLNQAVRKEIDTSRVQFERGSAQIEKGQGYLRIANGVLRGPLIGTTFQGTLYDRSGNMAMTGTFMPAYGLNRIFGEIPIFGAILGNGRDRGLIGVTYRLAGKARSPVLQINPLSVIAPGIFRSIFEFQ